MSTTSTNSELDSDPSDNYNREQENKIFASMRTVDDIDIFAYELSNLKLEDQTTPNFMSQSKSTPQSLPNSPKVEMSTQPDLFEFELSYSSLPSQPFSSQIHPNSPLHFNPIQNLNSPNPTLNAVPNFNPPVSDPRTPCKYGKDCYQTNPQHLAQYSHPKPEDNESENSPPSTTTVTFPFFPSFLELIYLAN